jgi:hypothetical protein
MSARAKVQEDYEEWIHLLEVLDALTDAIISRFEKIIQNKEYVTGETVGKSERALIFLEDYSSASQRE